MEENIVKDSKYIGDKYDMSILCIFYRCKEEQQAEEDYEEYRLQYYNNNRLGWVS